jgi:hypothetical protein
MRKGGLAALAAILVLASLGIGYFSGNNTRATGTVTSISTSAVTSTTTSISTSNAGVVTKLVAGTEVNHQVSDQYGNFVSFGLRNSCVPTPSPVSLTTPS